MRMADPDIVNNPDEFMKLSKSASDIEETVNMYREYKKTMEQLAEAKVMIKEETDQEMIEMAREEIKELENQEVTHRSSTYLNELSFSTHLRTATHHAPYLSTISRIQEALVAKLKLLLLPKDPLDDRNIMLEIRAGTGGEEAALWAADLARMYQRYSDSQGWRANVISLSEAESGGLKEVMMEISGERVYSKLKYESGVHRQVIVQCWFFSNIRF